MFPHIFDPTYDPNNFAPRDKNDHERANRAISAGYPAVEPVLWDLLSWLQDMNWPVAKTLAPFLAGIGIPLVPHIKKVFTSDDDIWKYWIINEILLVSPAVALELRHELERLAYSPSPAEIDEELQEAALNILKHYQWERNN